MGNYQSLIIWILVLAVVFAFLWYKGYLLRLSNYVQETKEELKKCTWPTRTELKGSTLLVIIGISILGGYTVGLDMVMTSLVRFVMPT